MIQYYVVGKTGDSTKEVCQGENRANVKTWNNGVIFMPNSKYPFMSRETMYYTTGNSRIFTGRDVDGNGAYADERYRIVLPG